MNYYTQMGPRDHRIHSGHVEFPKTPPQNNSSTKHVFFGTLLYPQKVPSPTCCLKIFAEADFGNFPKSLQQVLTANPSKRLSRIPPSKLQTEPRGEKTLSQQQATLFQFFEGAWPNILTRGAFGWPVGPPRSWSDSGTHFSRTCSKNLDF